MLLRSNGDADSEVAEFVRVAVVAAAAELVGPVVADGVVKVFPVIQVVWSYRSLYPE